jgi:hypothetical protein
MNNDPVNWIDLWGLSASDKQIIGDLGIGGFNNSSTYIPEGSVPSITIQGTSRVGNAEIIAKTAINIAFDMDSGFPPQFTGIFMSPPEVSIIITIPIK